MGIPGSANPMLFGGAAAYQINQSLRFNQPDAASFSKTFASAGNRRTYTLSFWMKAGKLTSDQSIFMTPKGSGYCRIDLASASARSINFLQWNGSSYDFILALTANRFRDPSAWYHIIVAVDTTQSTASNRVKFYINGNQETALDPSFNTYPSQNYDTEFNTATVHYIGYSSPYGPAYLDGYLAEVNYVDGQQLTPSSFGETDTITGAWIPKKYSGSYGTNGFYLKFEGSGIGTDSSGNGNNWTASGFSTSGTGTDVMSDTPTTNWCTLNPISLRASFNNDCNDGNLGIETLGGNWDRGTKGTIGASSGKWYWEYTHGTIASGYPTADIGITKYESEISANTSGGETSADTYLIQGNNGNKHNAGSGSSYGSAFTTGDICSIALDLDNGKVWFGKNGTWFNSGDPAAGTNAAFTGLTGTFWPLFYWGLSAGTSGVNQSYFNFGQRSFSYTPPTGFKALNTANLPEPTIKKGGDYFNTVLYTGNGTSQSLSAGFASDLVWVKNRSTANSHQLTDSVRGNTNALASDLTIAEYTGEISLTGSGFSVSGNANATNKSAETYVGWNWKESATAGFDIVTYTGNGAASQVVNHSLGVTPNFVIVKNRSNTASWNVWGSQGFTRLGLNIDNGDLGNFGITRGASSITLPSTSDVGWNALNENYVAYLWSEVASFSKFGSYTGNGSTDGPFVFCGFRPAYVWLKGSTFASNWNAYDSARDKYNITDDLLRLNSAAAEVSDYGATAGLDLLSNGFKLRTSSGDWNSSGQTFVFAAFSETAFKYSNAR